MGNSVLLRSRRELGPSTKTIWKLVRRLLVVALDSL